MVKTVLEQEKLVEEQTSSKEEEERGTWGGGGGQAERLHCGPARESQRCCCFGAPRGTKVGKEALTASMNLPAESSGLSSWRSSQAHAARDCPTLSSVRKKLLPQSATVTFSESTMVQLPRPRGGGSGGSGRTNRQRG